MTINIIAAIARNGVIGNEGKMPWHLSGDLRRFRKLTTGHVVVMGRKTYESLPDQLRPLPRRDSVVLTRQRGYEAPGAVVCHGVQEVLDAFPLEDNELWIAGGAETYPAFLSLADRFEMTLVDLEPEGDATFPGWGEPWTLKACGPYSGHRTPGYPVPPVDFDQDMSLEHQGKTWRVEAPIISKRDVTPVRSKDNPDRIDELIGGPRYTFLSLTRVS